MFDVSLSELAVVGVVALLVIGPEKLPKVARTLGALTGRFNRYVAQVKEEINREARFEDLQKLQQEIKQSVTQAKEIITDNVTQFNTETARAPSRASASQSKRASQGSAINVPALDSDLDNKKANQKSKAKRATTRKKTSQPQLEMTIKVDAAKPKVAIKKVTKPTITKPKPT